MQNPLHSFLHICSSTPWYVTSMNISCNVYRKIHWIWQLCAALFHRQFTDIRRPHTRTVQEIHKSLWHNKTKVIVKDMQFILFVHIQVFGGAWQRCKQRGHCAWDHSGYNSEIFPFLLVPVHTMLYWCRAGTCKNHHLIKNEDVSSKYCMHFVTFRTRRAKGCSVHLIKVNVSEVNRWLFFRIT